MCAGRKANVTTRGVQSCWPMRAIQLRGVVARSISRCSTSRITALAKSGTGRASTNARVSTISCSRGSISAIAHFLIGESTARRAGRGGRRYVDEPHDAFVTPAEVVTGQLYQSSTPPEADPKHGGLALVPSQSFHLSDRNSRCKALATNDISGRASQLIG